MPIQLPDLDDKTYADLVDEARTALPAIYPAWTDHNPTDPGVALIELMAWLTEMLVFRTGRIPERSERTFLRLLSGGAHGDEADLDAATETTLRDLRARYRAVTPADYLELLATAWPASEQVKGLAGWTPGYSGIARACCIPERDATGNTKLAAAPGHVSLLVMPSGVADPWTSPNAALLDRLGQFFTPRLVITTRLHCGGVTPVSITLTVTVGLRDDAPSGGATVRAAIQSALLEHFHPWRGGPAKNGWPFGRDVDVSDVLAVIDEVDGVEFVDTDSKTFSLTAPDDSVGSRNVMQDTKLLGLRIEAHELPSFAAANIAITLKERQGGVWAVIK